MKNRENIIKNAKERNQQRKSKCSFIKIQRKAKLSNEKYYEENRKCILINRKFAYSKQKLEEIERKPSK